MTKADCPGLVSVIIPSYNRADFIESAVESCLKQSYPKVEVILVDDGSTDSTAQTARKLIAKWGEDKVIYHYQTNQGVSAARNAGLNAARGEYIQFLDSDDFLSHEKFLIQVKALQDSGADAAVSDFQLIEHGTGKMIRQTRVGLDPLARMSRFQHVSVGAILVRKNSIPQSLRFDTRIFYGEDMVFFFSYMLGIRGWVYTPGWLMNYRQHPDQITKTVYFRQDYEYFLRSAIDFWRRERSRIPKDRKKVIEFYAQFLTIKTYVARDIAMAIRMAWLTIRVFPLSPAAGTALTVIARSLVWIVFCGWLRGEKMENFKGLGIDRWKGKNDLEASHSTGSPARA